MATTGLDNTSPHPLLRGVEFDGIQLDSGRASVRGSRRRPRSSPPILVFSRPQIVADVADDYSRVASGAAPPSLTLVPGDALDE